MSKDLASPIIKKTAIDKDGVAHYLVEGGLTKREVAAIAAMQGLLTTNPQNPPKNEIATRAVAYSDALLAELSKTP